MLRSIVNRRHARPRGRTTRCRHPAPDPHHRWDRGGSANREIEQGAKSLLRGASRKKRGL